MFGAVAAIRASGWDSRPSGLSLRMNLLSEVVVEARFFDDMELAFDPVNMLFFIH